MKKNNKRVFMFIMCLCLLMSAFTYALPGGRTAQAAQELTEITKWYSGFGYSYALRFTPIRGGREYKAACVESYAETNFNMQIPSAANGVPVTEIADRAFSYRELSDEDPEGFIGCSNMGSAFIPKSVRRIGEGAFEGCGYLEEVFFESNAACYEIGDRAFYNCGALNAVNLPENLARLGTEAFAGTWFYNDVLYNDSNPTFGLVAPVYIGRPDERWLAGLTMPYDEDVPPDGEIYIEVEAGTAGIADEAFLIYYVNYKVNSCRHYEYTELINVEFATDASPRVVGKNAFGGALDIYDDELGYYTAEAYTGNYLNALENPDGIAYIGNNVCEWAVCAMWDLSAEAYVLDGGVTGIANGCFEGHGVEDGLPKVSPFMPGGIEYIGADAYRNSNIIFEAPDDGPVVLGSAVVGFQGAPRENMNIIFDSRISVIAAMAFNIEDCYWLEFGYVRLGWNISYIGGGAFAPGQLIFVPDNCVKADAEDFPGYNFVNSDYLLKESMNDCAFYIEANTLLRFYSSFTYYASGEETTGTDVYTGKGAYVKLPFGVAVISAGAFTDAGYIDILTVPFAGKDKIVILRGILGENVSFGAIYVGFGQADDYKANSAWRKYKDYIQSAPAGLKASLTGKEGGVVKDIKNGMNFKLTGGAFTVTAGGYIVKAEITFPSGAAQGFTGGLTLTAAGRYSVRLTGYFGDDEAVYFSLDAVEIAPPTVEIAFDASFADPANKVYLMPKISFSDANGIESVVLQNTSGDGIWYKDKITSGTVLRGGEYPDGEYRLTVVNGAGKEKVVGFTLKNTPVLSYKTGGGYAPVNGEAVINCETLYLQVSNCPGAELTLNGSPCALDGFNASVANIAEGTYTFALTGTAGVSATFVIRIDKNIALPTIDISGAKKDNKKPVNGNVTVKGVKGGAGGGPVEKVTVYKDGVIIAEFEGADVDKVNGMKFRENGRYVIAASGASGYKEAEFDIQKKLGGGLAAASAAVPLAAAGGVFALGLRARKRRIV